MDKLDELLALLPFDPQYLTVLAIISVLMFLVSLLIIPWLIAQLPIDYFVDEERHKSQVRQLHPVLYYSLRFLKNAFGIVLVIAGILMLVLPGQGILTIIIGLGLVDFPGKFQLMRSMVQKPSVYKAINWIREKAKQEPMIRPD